MATKQSTKKSKNLIRNTAVGVAIVLLGWVVLPLPVMQTIVGFGLMALGFKVFSTKA